MSAPRFITAGLVIAALAIGGVILYRSQHAPAPVETPPQPAAPPATPMPPQAAPKLWKLANDVSCLEVEAFRYEGADGKVLGPWKPIGVLIANNCDAPRVFVDIKYSLTALEYVSSRLPAHAVMLSGAATTPAHIVTLQRGGDICEDAEPMPGTCKTLPLPPKSQLFIELPDQAWFLLKLKGQDKITGFFGLPHDPTKPRPVPKMPEMGFELKGAPAP